jgi:tRNA(Ile)-lysidine synthase TilS/MesJ
VLTTLTPGGNLQARAREARYAALRAAAAAAGAPLIATAHHADDRAETVLLRLLRGSGARGLAVLPPRNGDLVRPFTKARRKDIEAHLARHGVAFARDPSNDDPRYGRARVRNEVLPLLETLSPGVVAHLNALADELAALRENPREGALAASPGALLVRATEAAVRLFAEGTLEGLAGIEGIEDDPSREETRGRLTLELPGGLVATYVRGSLTVTVVKSPKSAPRWKHRHPDDHPMR